MIFKYCERSIYKEKYDFSLFCAIIYSTCPRITLTELRVVRRRLLPHGDYSHINIFDNDDKMMIGGHTRHIEATMVCVVYFVWEMRPFDLLSSCSVYTPSLLASLPPALLITCSVLGALYETGYIVHIKDVSVTEEVYILTCLAPIEI